MSQLFSGKDTKQQIVNASPNMPKACPYAMALSFWEIWHNLLPRKSCYHQGFSPWTASGFYPWGNVVSPREMVAEGLCGWRHGNSFPMTQSRTIPPPNAKHSTLLQGCFLCFCFFYSIDDSATKHNLSPHIFHWSRKCVAQVGNGHKKTAFGERRLILMTMGQKWLIIRGCCFRPSQGWTSSSRCGGILSTVPLAFPQGRHRCA